MDWVQRITVKVAIASSELSTGWFRAYFLYFDTENGLIQSNFADYAHLNDLPHVRNLY